MRRITIGEKVAATFAGHPVGTLFSTAEIVQMVHTEHGVNPASILPSDLCYNLTNKGNLMRWPVSRLPIFEFLALGEYKYLGPDYPYTGKVYHHPKSTKQVICVGQWNNGTYHAL